jgi:hypothetical protein
MTGLRRNIDLSQLATSKNDIHRLARDRWQT